MSRLLLLGGCGLRLFVFLAKDSLNLPFCILPLDGLPLFVFPFSPCKAELDLCPAVLQVETQRDKGEALFLDLAVESPDFPLVKEQLSGPCRVVIERPCVRIGGNIDFVEEGLVSLDAGITVLELDSALPDGLDLRSQKNEAGFVGRQDFIVVPGLLVLRDELDSTLLQRSWLLMRYAEAVCFGLSP